MDEDSGMNFSEYVAVLSGNTDLLEKAKLDKKIATLESERKNFLRERDAATGKLAEIDSSVSFHSDKIKEAKADLACFEKRVERDKEGNPINKLVIKGVEDSTDTKVIAARLQEINDKARTKGEYNKIGEIYGFSIMVKTESTSKDLFDCSVNRFFVKGQESIYYTYNNGKLATVPHQKELEVTTTCITEVLGRGDEVVEDIATRIEGKRRHIDVLHRIG